jgi:hypothetical protein
MRRRDREDSAGDLEPVPGGERPGERPGERSIERPEDLPVVARLVVEVRSDGRRTIARGAMEDPHSGQGVAIEARGDTPMQLALSLARSMFSMPMLGRSAARALLGRPRRRRRR